MKNAFLHVYYNLKHYGTSILTQLISDRILRSEEDHTIQQTQDLLDVLESGPDWLDDFDEQLFSDMIEKIVVVDNETLRFRLLNGLEVTEKIERTRR